MRIASLIMLFALMMVIRLFKFGGPFDDPLARTMVGFGFLLFAGMVAGELVSRISLPKITGYLISGMICGPYLLGLLDTDVVERLKTIDDLALALIAFTAGGELHIDRLKKAGRAIAAITLSQTAFSFVIVGSVAFLAAVSFGRMVGMPLLAAVALGMYFGLVTSANSPATAVAVIVETESRGYLTDQILGVTVLKDIVILFFAAFILTLGGWMTDPTKSLEIGLILTVLLESLLSIVFGIIAAALIALYLRFIKREMVLFVLATSLIIVFLSEYIHLHFLLVCMTAGFCIENYSRYGDNLISAIERTSMTIYVIFFAIAGASINFGILKSIWPIALILVVLRALSFAGGTWIAGVITGGTQMVKRYSWSGYLGQAGISLGIASLVLEGSPEMGSMFYTIVVASIAINQIIGPVALKFLLSKAGETVRHRIEENIGGLQWQ